MTRTVERLIGDGNSYALPADDVDTHTTTNKIDGIPIGTGGMHKFVDVGDGSYVIFIRAGETPASTDRVTAQISAAVNVPSAEEISNRLERTDGPIDKVPKFDDTIQRDKTSASSSQMVETLTKVTE